MKTYIVMMFCILSLLFVPPAAQSQEDFPNKPIQLLVGLAAGGTADLSTRLLGKIAEKYIGQPVVIMNKPGASGTLAIASIATAKPDGYTIGYISTSPMLIVPQLMNLTYHPIKDIEPILQYGSHISAVSVLNGSPFKTFKEIIEHARKNPGATSYGTAGTNNAQHIIMKMITRKENVELIHVPFKSGPESLAAVMGGHVIMTVGDFNLSLIKAKKVRFLAMLLEERWSEYPDIPTLKEIGYSVPLPYLMALGAPKGVPEPIIKKLEEAFAKASQEPEFSPGMKSFNLNVSYRNRKDLRDYLAREYEGYAKILKELNITK